MAHKSPEQKRFDRTLTLHHRKPKSIGGAKNDDRNKSWIPRLQHNSWHNCFGTMTAENICDVINRKYLDPDYRFICIKQTS